MGRRRGLLFAGSIMKQSQIRVLLSTNLRVILESKAEILGITLTQFIKYLLIKEVENPLLPVSNSDEILHNKENMLKHILRKSLAADVYSIISKQKKESIY